MTNIHESAKIAEDLILETYDSYEPGVAYLISCKDEILLSGGTGKANIEWDIPISDDTVLRLGSISKPITAIAALQLVEQGKLNLDAPISTYAPDLPDHIKIISMRQLLSHRSGLAEHVFDENLIPYIWQPMTIEKIIELQDGKSKVFNPGEKYEYVNFNYVIVAHVLEAITGQNFVGFVNENIFLANNMNSSFYEELDAIIPKRAEFYDQAKDGRVKNTAAVDLSHVSAAGAFVSTVKDMSHWVRKLIDGELINPNLLKEAWTPKPLPDGTSTEYGLGFNIEYNEKENLIWHTGMTPGSHAAVKLAPETGIFLIVLCNGFHLPSTGKLVDDLMMIMLKGSV
jgi:CubicO group peptidase (beta-lactamase class C family)